MPTLAALRRRRTWARFQAAATLGRTANEMFPVAVVLFLIERGAGPGLAGAAAAAFLVPSFLSGPFLGAWLDRRGHPARLLAFDQAFSASAILALALTAGTAPATILALSLLAGAASPLSYGGFTALLPSVVRDGELHRAYAVEATSFNVAIVLGPAIAGIVAGTIDPQAALIVQAGIKLAALMLVASIRVSPGPGHRRPAPIAEGFRQILRTRPLLAITAVGAIALGGRGLLTVGFPLFAADNLDTGTDFGAYLWTAYAAGSIAGIAATTRRAKDWSPELTACVATAAGGIVMLLWPLSASPVSALALVAAAGVAYGPGLAATFTVRQAWTPEELRGQVFATAASLKPGCFALGSAASGTLVAGVGAAATLALAAVAQLLAAGTGVLLLGRIAPRGRHGDPDAASASE